MLTIFNALKLITKILIIIFQDVSLTKIDTDKNEENRTTVAVKKIRKKVMRKSLTSQNSKT